MSGSVAAAGASLEEAVARLEKVPVSVFILTKNEQQDLPGCLESVQWADEICILDSYSTDLTLSIAAEHGATVVQRAFDDWSTHQNWGLTNVTFKHRWVLYMDADERITDGLRQAIASAVADPGDCVAFRIRRRDFLGKTWLRHVQASRYYIRLFIPSRVTYERLVNPYTSVDGPIGHVGGYIDHFPFSKGIRYWVERHNSYSTFEARQILENAAGRSKFDPLKAVFGKDITERRFHQKELFYRLPARPVLKFLLLYVLRGGFLDGRAGFSYALLQSVYEQMIVLKTQELRHTTRVGVSDASVDGS